MLAAAWWARQHRWVHAARMSSAKSSTTRIAQVNNGPSTSGSSGSVAFSPWPAVSAAGRKSSTPSVSQGGRLMPEGRALSWSNAHRSVKRVQRIAAESRDTWPRRSPA